MKQNKVKNRMDFPLIFGIAHGKFANFFRKATESAKDLFTIKIYKMCFFARIREAAAMSVIGQN